MPILRIADSPLQPWKNGLGRTREIAVHPAQAGMDDFLWRVSVAEVDSAAPFSSFPGIDRIIVLLDGAGFTMRLDDARTHALTVPLAPFAFPGEARVTVALAGGPTRDFNLMLRRDRVRGRVEVWRDAGPRAPDPGIALVYCARGTIDVPGGVLAAGDAWRPASTAAPGLHPGALALAVRIEAAD
jgi:environmental stress-induced protein Ves